MSAYGNRILVLAPSLESHLPFPFFEAARHNKVKKNDFRSSTRSKENSTINFPSSKNNKNPCAHRRARILRLKKKTVFMCVSKFAKSLYYPRYRKRINMFFFCPRGTGGGREKDILRMDLFVFFLWSRGAR